MRYYKDMSRIYGMSFKSNCKAFKLRWYYYYYYYYYEKKT